MNREQIIYDKQIQKRNRYKYLQQLIKEIEEYEINKKITKIISKVDKIRNNRDNTLIIYHNDINKYQKIINQKNHQKNKLKNKLKSNN